MIMMFGMAGTGKSTQGNMLAEKFGWKWLSVGQCLRETGKYDDILQRGELVNDQQVIELMSEQIEKVEQDGFNVILDGYPRDITQAEWMAANIADKLEGSIILTVPKDELWRRIELRGRADDTRESLDRRFKVFEDNMKTIREIMEGKGIRTIEVDGTGTIEEVCERTTAALLELCPSAEIQENDVNDDTIEQSYGE